MLSAPAGQRRLPHPLPVCAAAPRSRVGLWNYLPQHQAGGPQPPAAAFGAGGPKPTNGAAGAAWTAGPGRSGSASLGLTVAGGAYGAVPEGRANAGGPQGGAGGQLFGAGAAVFGGSAAAAPVFGLHALVPTPPAFGLQARAPSAPLVRPGRLCAWVHGLLLAGCQRGNGPEFGSTLPRSPTHEGPYCPHT